MAFFLDNKTVDRLTWKVPQAESSFTIYHYSECSI